MEVIKHSGEAGEMKKVAGEEVTLLHLPYPVYTKIVKMLDLKDILNMRLTSTGTFNWVKNSSEDLKKRLSKKRVRLLSLQHFIDFGNSLKTLPFSLFLIKVDQEMFKPESALQLLPAVNKFGSSINRLVVSNMYCCVSDGEFQFYNLMTSLKSLHVIFSIELPDANSTESVESTNSVLRVPQSFVNTLESFNFEQKASSLSSFYPYDILATCPRLKFISIPPFGKTDGTPFISHPSHPPILTRPEMSNAEIRKFTEALKARKQIGGQNLNILTNWRVEENVWKTWNRLEEPVGREFLGAVGLGGVSLLNFNVALVETIHKNKSKWDEDTLLNILQSIRHLIGICPAIQMFKMERLKTLRFVLEAVPEQTEYHNSFVQDWDAFYNSQSVSVWPNLWKIYGYISWIKDWKDNDTQKARDVLAMLNFLLRPFKPRTSLKELSFTSPLEFTLLTPEHFTVKFPNLQRMWLTVKSFNKADYSNLFLLLGIHTRIRSLELRSSVLLDDETFFGPTGPHDSVPYFSTLKYLKDFSLSDTYSLANESLVCGITDKCFVSLFSCVPFETLTISGNDLPHVSEIGLEALVNGPFGKTVCNCYFSLPCVTMQNPRVAAALKTLEDSGEFNTARKPDSWDWGWTLGAVI